MGHVLHSAGAGGESWRNIQNYISNTTIELTITISIVRSQKVHRYKPFSAILSFTESLKDAHDCPAPTNLSLSLSLPFLHGFKYLSAESTVEMGGISPCV